MGPHARRRRTRRHCTDAVPLGATRILPLAVAVALLLPATACDRFGRQEEAEPTRPVLTLTVAIPEVLYWGGSGRLHLTLANEGETAAAGGIVEVFVPAWLEFGTVEPAGTAVTVVSGDTETTLRYQLTDSLPPGDSRLITQHLRVLPRGVAPAPQDSMDPMELEPSNQLVRARLLTAAGEPVGVEVQATLNFVGGAGPPPSGDSARDTAAARRAPPDTAAARALADTTIGDTLTSRR